MTFLSGLTFVLAASLLAHGAPTDADIALARRYAPQFRFHKDEIYWPSTVEYFLAGVKLVDANGGVVASSVTGENIDDAANQGSGLFLSTDINAGKANFLRGQNPTTGAPNVNTFIAKKANGVVDLYYWLFTPFNFGKSVPALGQIGDHVGDWERLTVRTVNGVPTQVDYHAHGDTGSGTIPYSQVIKFDTDRPVGYVSRGSHGFWATAGTFTYVNAVIFKLQDVTGDGGVAWDTRDVLVPLAYPDTFSGKFDWLNYKGKWGNLGSTSCWWYIFYNGCSVIDGPGGPLRDDVLGAAKAKLQKNTADIMKTQMKGPLSQVLGVTSTESTSKITLRLTSDVTSVASAGSYTHLAIEQRCAEPAPTEEDPEATIITTTFASTELTDATTFTIQPAACSSGLISAYTIGLCSTENDTDCIWSASARNLRAFSDDASLLGVQDAIAIVVDDLDDWEW